MQMVIDCWSTSGKNRKWRQELLEQPYRKEGGSRNINGLGRIPESHHPQQHLSAPTSDLLRHRPMELAKPVLLLKVRGRRETMIFNLQNLSAMRQMSAESGGATCSKGRAIASCRTLKLKFAANKKKVMMWGSLISPLTLTFGSFSALEMESDHLPSIND